MSISINALALREGSVIATMFNELSDGKVHKLSTFRAKYEKKGVLKVRAMLFRLCRILRRVDNGRGKYQINSSKRTDTVQIVLRDKAAAAREAVKRSAAKNPPVVKSVTKKVTKKVVTKPSKAKAVREVVAAIESDDDILIEA